jgi:hypothetical protein
MKKNVIRLALVASLALAGSVAVAAPASAATPNQSMSWLLNKVRYAGVGATSISLNTNRTDPNHLLGKPGQYVARGSYDLPGGARWATDGAGARTIDRGGVIELFTTQTKAKARAAYIKSAIRSVNRSWPGLLDGEVHCLRGNALIRTTTHSKATTWRAYTICKKLGGINYGKAY